MNSPSLTLGLDVGSNSLGWALVEQNPQGSRIVGAGVRVFPEGVDRDQKGGELSKNEQRRMARAMRRQLARRARRKRALRAGLVLAGLLPEQANLRADDPQRVAWESTSFKYADPYELRAKALKEKIPLHDLGRVFLHLAQRRGFLSNRKKDRSEQDKSKLLQSIGELDKELQATNQTLGQHLANIRETDLRSRHLQRVRGLHTRRDMYQKEFEAIWTKQKEFYPELLTDQLKFGNTGQLHYPSLPQASQSESLLHQFGLHGLIFFQRPMYWPKSAIGKCELEPKLPRCPRADRAAQRFRLLQEVNNLRLLDTDTAEERPLAEEERLRLLNWLEKHDKIKFEEIPAKLHLLEGVRFNLQRGDRSSLQGMQTDCLLAKKGLFGKDWWDKPDEEKTAIVRDLLDDRLNDDALQFKAVNEWGLSQEAAEKVVSLGFPDGHARYSLVAIEKLLPHLEKGLPLNSATGELCALSEAGYKKPHERALGQKDELPNPPDITNPLVRQSLFEIRKVVNALIREFGKPTRIHIEMAREIKGNAEDRARLTRDMRAREAARDLAAAEIRAAGHQVNGPAITRYLLWQEQEKVCVYSGKCISLAQLLGGEVDEDHILPYPRSLDNSQMNRVLCFRDENKAKGDRTPMEWLANLHPEKFQEVLQRAGKLPFTKARRFRQPTVELNDFFARQFQDTAYIATQVRDYVACLGTDVVCTKGQHTAELRRRWGLNTVLRDDCLDLKNREDHRHHAVDALVIALTDRSRLQGLAKLHRTLHLGKQADNLEEPWEGFRLQVEQSINSLNVSHRALRKIRGALHEETVYSPTKKTTPTQAASRPWARSRGIRQEQAQPWIEEEGVFTYRKPLETLTLAEVGNIRDQRVKEIVLERLRRFQIVAGRKKRGEEEEVGNRAIPKEVWKEPLYVTPIPVPGNQQPANNRRTAIKKVRIVKKENTIRPLGETSVRHVKPGSLHHLCLFEFQNDKGKMVREAVFVDMIEASRRVRQKESIIQRIHPRRPDARFLFSLCANDLLLIEHQGLERLYRFVTAASTSKQMWFRHHIAAGKSGDKRAVISKKPDTLKAKKVTVDTLGRLRWAND